VIHALDIYKTDHGPGSPTDSPYQATPSRKSSGMQVSMVRKAHSWFRSIRPRLDERGSRIGKISAACLRNERYFGSGNGRSEVDRMRRCKY
jgi:hypothetical protein